MVITNKYLSRLLFILFIQFFLLNQTALDGFDGVYIGGVTGGAILQGNQRGNALGTLATNTYPLDLQSDLFSESWSNMFYAGFGNRWRGLYGGVEFFGQYAHHDFSLRRQNVTLLPLDLAGETLSDTTHIKVGPWQWGVDARPGLLLGKTTLLYGRVGVGVTKVLLETESTNTGSLDDISPFNLAFRSSQQRKGGFLRLGAGVEQHFSPAFSFRADYIFTDYGKLSLSGNNQADIFTLSSSKRVHLQNHSLMVGLSYYFSRCCEDEGCTITYCRNSYCGHYIGLGLGGALTHTRSDLNVINISPGPGSGALGIHPNNVSEYLIEENVRGTVFGGYGVQYGLQRLKFFTGLELFAQYSPHSVSKVEQRLFTSGFNPNLYSTLTTSTTRVRFSPWQYGVDLRFGLLLTQRSLLYGTVGTSVASLHTRVDSRFLNPALSLPPLDVSLSARNTRSVLRVGGGIERDFLCGWHIRADYRYTDYRSVHLAGFGFTKGNGILSLRVNSKIHPKDHAVTLGLVRYL